MSDVFKALADPTRRTILEMLREREMTAGEIAEHFTLAKPTLSGHLNVLFTANLVHRERIGTTLIYHLKLSVLEEAWLCLAASMRLGKDIDPCKKDTALSSPSQ